MSSPRALLLASAAAACLATAMPARAQTVSGRATVIDGETLEIRGTRIRVFGLEQVADDHVCVRTDDERWKCGPRALNALDELLTEAVVSCVMRERDALGRSVGVCQADGLDLSLWLLRSGLATAASGAPPRYLKAEAEARSARRGWWAENAPPRRSYRD